MQGASRRKGEIFWILVEGDRLLVLQRPKKVTHFSQWQGEKKERKEGKEVK
jgi:hypothetical protein